MLGVKMWLWGLVSNKSCISSSWVDLSFSRRVDKSVKQNKRVGIRARTEKAACLWLRSLIGLWLTTFLYGPLSECTRSFYFNHTLFVFLLSEFCPPPSPRPPPPPQFIPSLPLQALSLVIKPNLLPYLVCVHILMLPSDLSTLLPSFPLNPIWTP